MWTRKNLPDYVAEYAKRQKRLLSIRGNPVMLKGAKEYYRLHPHEFVQDWLETFDPRNASDKRGRPTKLPFIFFPRQHELVTFLLSCVQDEESGLIEKCRDMGATWVSCAFSVWLWLYWPGASVGWGSRKEQLVDRLGDADSIFEKIRMIVRSLPREFLPPGFSFKEHATFMKLINPENGASITGEAGDNIGRGGRKLIYFKDEAQPLSCRILTPDGWQTMGDMRVGSRVIGADGKPCNVVAVNDAGAHPVYRVTFSDGTSTRCSSNHLWTVWRDNEWLTVRTRHLRTGDATPLPFRDHKTPGPVVVCVSPETPEIVRCITVDNSDGLYLTDNCIVTHNSAHYERPELIEAALGDNTNTQIDISSVNGVGNVFYRRRQNGVVWPDVEPYRTRVFIMDWRDHPDKDEHWYERRRKKFESDGLLHIFKQEVDRDYASSVDGVIIDARHIRAAIDAHKVLGIAPVGQDIAALDVADEGADRNALARRRGIVLTHADHWGERDTGETTRRTVQACVGLGTLGCTIYYDAVGIGAGVKAEANRLATDKRLPPGLEFVPWVASASPLWPEKNLIPGDRNTPKNEDFYKNLKAQGWWLLARRFERTYRAVMAAQGKGDPFTYDPSDLISLDSSLPRLREIEQELAQPTMGRATDLRLIVNKTPPGTRSPNLGDAIMMAYHPVKSGGLSLAQLQKALS